MGWNFPGGNFMGGNFPGGSTPWGSLIGGNFPGGSFPDILNLQLIQIGMGFFDTGFPSLIPGFQ